MTEIDARTQPNTFCDLMEMRSMKIRVLTMSLVVLFFAVSPGIAAPKADFNGKWLMDRNKSEGLPPGMDQVMIIKQSGDQINLDTRVLPDEQLGYTQSDVYVLNGQETAFAPRRAGVEGKGKRTAKWTDEGMGIEVVEEIVHETPQGKIEIQATRKWLMSGDGKTITIEMSQKDAKGTTRSKRIFTKLPPQP
jgi:hypothetical protein